MASISDYTSNFGTGISGLNISLPANTSSQLLVLCVSMDATTNPVTISTPSGWTLVSAGVSSASSVDSAIFYKVGDGSTLESVSATGTTVWLAAVALVIDDANLASIPDGSDKDGTGNATTHNAAATGITTTVVNDLVIGLWGFVYIGSASVSAPSGMNTDVQITTGSSGLNLTVLIASYTQAAIGSTGTRAAHSSGATSANLLFAIKSYLGPSRATQVFPNGGESITAGSTVTLDCSPASSPAVAASTLQYEYSYSSDYGGSWTTIGLTSAGVTTKAWTVPSGPISGGWFVRVRAKDPASGLFSLIYDLSDSAFSVIAEVAPNAPTITTPAAGSGQNKGSLVTHTYTAGDASGNPVTESTWLYSRDNFASHTSSPIVVSGSSQSTTIDYSAEANGATISVKVKRKGISLYSVYSAVRSFVVASLPATPNITAPTAGSPPTTPNPTQTFTESETFIARKTRVVQGGSEVSNSGWVYETVLSFISPFAYANGVAYTLYLSVLGIYGLASAEDSETFTASYTGPTAATIAATNVNSGGYNAITITNSGSISYNEIWRYLNGAAASTAIRIAVSLPANASFQDYNAKSGQAYKYFVRTYNSSGLYTDSSASSAVTLTLASLFLHSVSRTGTGSNSTLALALNNMPASGFAFADNSARHTMLGRALPVAVFGQAVWQSLDQTVYPLTSADVTNLLSIFDLNETVCARDQYGNRIFGVLQQPQIVPVILQYRATIKVTETSYTEAL